MPLHLPDPVPVRIPVAAVTQLLHRASRSAEGEYLLGFAINCYLAAGRRVLHYVVLLDVGNELHLPCGMVEPILLS